jgi:hypothetical protein
LVYVQATVVHFATELHFLSGMSKCIHFLRHRAGSGMIPALIFFFVPQSCRFLSGACASIFLFLSMMGYFCRCKTLLLDLVALSRCTLKDPRVLVSNLYIAPFADIHSKAKPWQPCTQPALTRHTVDHDTASAYIQQSLD